MILHPDKKPYFECVLSLSQDSNHEIASISNKLLTKVQCMKRLTEKFRQEVEFENSTNTARIRMYLHTPAWFDVYLYPQGLETGIKIAQEYITESKQQIIPGPVQKSVTNKKLASVEEFEICTPYRNTGQCNSSEYTESVVLVERFQSDEIYYNYYCTEYHSMPHPKFICRTMCETTDGREKSCGFYIPDTLLINNLSRGVNSVIFKPYVVALRRDLIRTLLLVPPNHRHNEELVVSPSFWSYLLNLHLRLGFHRVALNFGKWESELSLNKYAYECHGHANLYFDEDKWENIKNVAEDPIHSRIDMSVNSGPEYLLADCEELENYLQRFIIQSQQSFIQAQQSTIQEHQSTIQEHQSIIQTQQSTIQGQQNMINFQQAWINYNGFLNDQGYSLEESHNSNNDEELCLNCLIPGQTDFHQIRISPHEYVSALKQKVKEELDIRIENFTIECFIQGRIPTQDVILTFQDPNNSTLGTRKMFPDGKVLEYFGRAIPDSNQEINIIVRS